MWSDEWMILVVRLLTSPALTDVAHIGHDVAHDDHEVAHIGY